MKTITKLKCLCTAALCLVGVTPVFAADVGGTPPPVLPAVTPEQEMRNLLLNDEGTPQDLQAALDISLNDNGLPDSVEAKLQDRAADFFTALRAIGGRKETAERKEQRAVFYMVGFNKGQAAGGGDSLPKRGGIFTVGVVVGALIVVLVCKLFPSKGDSKDELDADRDEQEVQDVE